MKTKRDIRAEIRKFQRLGLGAEGGFETGAIGALRDALTVPTRELRRWTAREMAGCTDALAAEDSPNARAFYIGRRAALVWMRRD